MLVESLIRAASPGLEGRELYGAHRTCVARLLRLLVRVRITPFPALHLLPANVSFLFILTLLSPFTFPPPTRFGGKPTCPSRAACGAAGRLGEVSVPRQLQQQGRGSHLKLPTLVGPLIPSLSRSARWHQNPRCPWSSCHPLLPHRPQDLLRRGHLCRRMRSPRVER